jgi:hypothetical protein
MAWVRSADPDPDRAVARCVAAEGVVERFFPGILVEMHVGQPGMW